MPDYVSQELCGSRRDKLYKEIKAKAPLWSIFVFITITASVLGFLFSSLAENKKDIHKNNVSIEVISEKLDQQSVRFTDYMSRQEQRSIRQERMIDGIMDYIKKKDQ